MFCPSVPTLIYLWEIIYSRISLPLWGPILGIDKSLTDKMNVEIGTQVAKFPEKEYKNGISVAVWSVF